MNYKKLTESELDMQLLNAYFPKRRERINFSNVDTFRTMIIKIVIEADIIEDFIDGLLKFADIDKKTFSITEDIFTLITIDIKFLKMAALEAFHVNKEHISI